MSVVMTRDDAVVVMVVVVATVLPVAAIGDDVPSGGEW